MSQQFARCVWDSIRPESGVKRRMGFELSERIGTHKNVVVETRYSEETGDHYTYILPANELFEAIPCGRPVAHREGRPLALPMVIHGCSRPVRALQYIGFKANERPFNSDAPYPQPVMPVQRRSSGLTVREGDPYFGDEEDIPQERHEPQSNYVVVPEWVSRLDAEVMCGEQNPTPEPTPEQQYVTVADLELERPNIRPWRVWRTTEATF